ncbi:hypothetical protein CFP65_5104 [Kitasatospora sp. MMS16-BH015]|uniref:hypothetical protein n=1 Tax=Kitasatospora sp. MMS16-BH015 TaxID=2018025 RepID=UPI000CA2D8DE|nr:hypothetical protein [Kitasatospora sp. MMS16-BH015]AUG79815.1 hypothetical protein CFP65_5104 [Kitasatospora sp. MMS16-BH015]
MSQSAQATATTPAPAATANPRRTTLASIEDFSQLPGARTVDGRLEYAVKLPTSTANPRRTILMVAPAPRTPLV